MNELAVMTDNELTKALHDVELRECALQTSKGQEKAAEMMLEVLKMIEAAGYPAKSDLASMAMAWVMLLREQIALYSMAVIREAACEFIMSDIREYKQFPSVGQIADTCNRIGKNPRAEVARRREEAIAEQMKAERQAELDALPKEYKDECVRRYGHLWGGCGD